MLESIAAKIISSYLGEYVEGLDADNLEVSLSSGETSFSNLKLKKTIFQELSFPISLREGYLRKLKMKIPWRNLGSEPAIATIEGLYLIVSPKPRSDTTAKEEENRAQSAKQRRLKLAELLGSDRKHDKDSEEAGDKGKKKKKKKKSGFIKKMRMKVVNNVQIFVNNVHIRFEDNISNPRQPYAAGLTIDHFHAQSTDGDWKPTFLKLGEELAHKLITLKDLAIYWDHAADKSQVHLKYKDHAQMAEIMDQLAADAALNTAAAVATVTQPHLQSNKGGPPLTPAVPAMLSKPAPSAKGHHYIIRPISGVLKATMWNGAALRLDQPKMKLDVELETVELGLNRVQFSSLLDILDYFSQYNANSRYMKYRPKGGVTPQENPRGWWQYAINSVRATIREKNEQWSWEHMMQWKRHRQRYIELYRDKKSGKRKLKSAEAQELSDLEHAHSYKDLLTWRRLANAAIDIKKMKKKEDKEREKQERKEKQQKFFSKLLLKSDKKKSKSKDKDKVKDKDKERDKDKDKDKSRWMSSKKKDKKSKSSKSDSLEESAGGMDDDSLDESSIADSETSSVMSAGMSDDGSASGDNLGSDAVGSAADQQAAEALKELYRAIDYNDTDGDDKQKEYPPEYVKQQLSFSLKKGSLELMDGLESTSKLANLDFNHVNVSFAMRSGGSFSLDAKLKTIRGKDYFTMGHDAKPLSMIEPDLSQITAKHWKIVSVVLDKKPPDRPVDLGLSAQILPMTITLSKPLLDKIISFFKPKREQGKNLKKLASRASKAAAGVSQRTAQRGLHYLGKHRVLQIDLDFQAPRLIVPENCAEPNCPALIVDLGHLTLSTSPPASTSSGSTSSSPVDAKKTKKKSQSQSQQQLTTSTTSEQSQEDMLYDTFLLSLRHLSAFVLPDRQVAIDWENEASLEKFAVISKFNLGFTFKMAQGDAPSLPKFKLSGKLPALHLNVTKEKVRALLTVVRAITAKDKSRGSSSKQRAASKISSRSKGAPNILALVKSKNRDKIVNMIGESDVKGKSKKKGVSGRSGGSSSTRLRSTTSSAKLSSSPIKSSSSRRLARTGRVTGHSDNDPFGDNDDEEEHDQDGDSTDEESGESSSSSSSSSASSIGDDDDDGGLSLATPDEASGKTEARQLLEASFEMTEFMFVVSETTIMSQEETAVLPLIIVQLSGLSAHVKVSSLDAHAKFQLLGLIVHDKLAERSTFGLPKHQPPPSPQYLLSSFRPGSRAASGDHTGSGSDALVMVTVDAIDKRSPQYKGEGLAITASMGSLDVQINRPTIAACLQLISEFGKKKPKKRPTATNTDASPFSDSISLLPASFNNANLGASPGSSSSLFASGSGYNPSSPTAKDVLQLLRARESVATATDPVDPRARAAAKANPSSDATQQPNNNGSNNKGGRKDIKVAAVAAIAATASPKEPKKLSAAEIAKQLQKEELGKKLLAKAVIQVKALQISLKKENVAFFSIRFTELSTTLQMRRNMTFLASGYLGNMAIRKELTLTPSALALAEVDAAASAAATERLSAAKKAFSGAVPASTTTNSFMSTTNDDDDGGGGGKQKKKRSTRSTSVSRSTRRSSTVTPAISADTDASSPAETAIGSVKERRSKDKDKGKEKGKEKEKKSKSKLTKKSQQQTSRGPAGVGVEKEDIEDYESEKDMFGNDSRWSDLLIIEGDRVVSFTVEKFSPKTSDYPGYSLAIKSSVESMRLVVVQNIISEILFYFGGLSKMQSFLGKLKGKTSSKTEKAGLKVDVSIDNPYIIIPKNSRDPDYMYVDLGKIIITNSHNVENDMKIEAFKFDMAAVNIRTVIKNLEGRMVDRAMVNDIDINVTLKRSLTKDPDHKLPNIMVGVNVDKLLSTDVSSDKLEMLLDVLAGNVAELPLRPDEAEFRMVMAILQASKLNLLRTGTNLVKGPGANNGNGGSGSSSGRAALSERLNYVRYHVDVRLNKVSLRAYMGSDADNQATSLIRAVVHHLNIRVAFERDASVVLHMDAETLLVEDAREGTLNQFKTLVCALGNNPLDANSSSGSPEPQQQQQHQRQQQQQQPQFSFKFESRPKDRYQSASIKLLHPQIFMIPSALEQLVAFGLPVINQALRSVNMFTRRRKVGSGIDKRLKYLLAEGSLKQRHMFELQELVAKNASEITELERSQRELVLNHMNQASEADRKSAKTAADKDTTQLLSTMRAKHEHKIKALKQAHMEQFDQFRRMNAVLVTPTVRHVGGMYVKVLAPVGAPSTGSSRTSQSSSTASASSASSSSLVLADYTPPPRARRERKVKAILQSPEIYLIKDCESVSGSSTAFVFKLSDSVINFFDAAEKKKADLHLFEIYALKCDLETKTLSSRDSIMLLKPFNVDVAVERVPSQRLLQANVEINVVNTIISYKDLRVAIGVLRSFRAMLKTLRVTMKREKARKNAVKSALAAAIVAAYSTESKIGISGSPALPTWLVASSAATLQSLSGGDGTTDSNPLPALVGAEDGVGHAAAEQQATLRITQLEFSLLNDTNPDFVTPLLKMEIQLIENHIHLMKGRRKLSAMVEDVYVSAYNNDLATYEPIVEPWNLTFLVMQDTGRRVVVELSADKTLNLNLTKSLVDTIFNARRFLQELTKKKKGDKLTSSSGGGDSSSNNATNITSSSLNSSGEISKKRQPATMNVIAPLSSPNSPVPSLGPPPPSSSFASSTSTSSSSPSPSTATGSQFGRSFFPFVLQNHTFKKLKYWYSGASEETAKVLAARSEVPLAVPTLNAPGGGGASLGTAAAHGGGSSVAATSSSLLGDEGSISSKNQDNKFEIELQLQWDQEAPVFHNVPLDKVHVKGYTISTEKNLHLITQVINKAGTKVLTVRTSKYIENKTSSWLDLMIIDSQRTTPHRTTLEPNSVQSIPLEYFQYKAIYIRPRPYGPPASSSSSSDQDATSTTSAPPTDPTLGGLGLVPSSEFGWFEWKSGEGSVPVECKDESQDLYWCCSLKYEEPMSYGDVVDPNYQAICLHPILTIENLLVGMMLFKMSSDRGKEWDYSSGLEPGEEVAVYYFRRAKPREQVISIQLGGFYWSPPVDMGKLWDPKLTRPYQHTVQLQNTNGTDLDIFAVVDLTDNALKMSLFSKYWIVNQTGLPLAYRYGSRGSSRFGETDKRVIDLVNDDPRQWYAGKMDDFKSVVAAQKFYYPYDEISIQVAESEWSPPLTLDAKKEDRPDALFVSHSKVSKSFSFAHKISTAPGRFWRTSEVRLFPSVILVNKTHHVLQYAQYEEDTSKPGVATPKARAFELLQNDQIPFHWPRMNAREKYLQLNIKGMDTHWSGHFSIDQIDNFMLKIREKSKAAEGSATAAHLGAKAFHLVNVSIKSRRGITYVVFRPGEDNYIALYQIENQTSQDLLIQQKYVDFVDVIPAKKRVTIFWDQPRLKRKVVLRIAGNSSARAYELNFEKDEGVDGDADSSSSGGGANSGGGSGGGGSSFGGGGGGSSLGDNSGTHVCPDWELRNLSRTKYQVNLLRHGYSNILLIYDENDMAQNSVVQQMIKTETKTKSEHLEIDAKFATLAISLIDTTPQEVVYVTLQNTTLHIDKVGVEYLVQFSAQTGQVDNQLYRAPEPVAVYPIPSDTAIQTAEQHHASLTSQAKKSSFITFEIHIDRRESNITHFNKIFFALQPIDLNLDQIFILKLQTFFAYMMKYIGKKTDVEALALAKEDVLPMMADKSLAEGDKFYFQNVDLEQIDAVLSLRRGSNKSVTTAFKGTSIKRILENILAVSSIERQNIVLNACRIKSTFCSWNDFTKRIVRHYARTTYSNISALLLNYVTKFGRSLFSTKRVVTPSRPPRYFPPDNLVVLYDLEQSYGQKLLRSIKGREFLQDNYFFHCWISTQCIIGSQNFLLMLDNGESVWLEKMREVIACLVEDGNVLKVFLLGLAPTAPGAQPSTQAARERSIQCRTREQVEYIASKIDAMVAKNKSEFSNVMTFSHTNKASQPN